MFKSLKTIASVINYICKSFIKLTPVKPFTAKQSPATGCTCANITTWLWLVMNIWNIGGFTWLFIIIIFLYQVRRKSEKTNEKKIIDPPIREISIFNLSWLISVNARTIKLEGSNWLYNSAEANYLLTLRQH